MPQLADDGGVEASQLTVKFDSEEKSLCVLQ
jgi:hypothetical protein